MIKEILIISSLFLIVGCANIDSAVEVECSTDAECWEKYDCDKLENETGDFACYCNDGACFIAAD